MRLEKGHIKDGDLEPDLGPFGFYIGCYNELTTCRNESGLPIPFTAIVEYANIFEIHDFEDFLGIIRLLDNYHINKEIEKQKPKDDNLNKPKG